MVENTIESSGPALGDAEFEVLRRLVHEAAGIALSPAKRQLLTSRVARRLRALGYQTFAEYIRYVTHSDPTGDERQQLVNCITTNKTDFFREPHHFEFLRDKAVPHWLARGGSRRVRVWSAGCSIGMEPYSIALTLREHLPAGFQVEVLATDIDTEVLARAARGVYGRADCEPVPPAWLQKHFLRGTGANAGRVQVRSEVRRLVTFRQFNLNQPAWDVPGGFDAVFCRNVVIYFDRRTQQHLFDRFADRLADDGFLFIGHSENLHGVSTRFAPLGGTVYRPVPAAGAAEVPVIAGELFAAGTPVTVRTVVGSCVAACLFDPVARVGGMNHFLLPGAAPPGGDPGRFGVPAMGLLVDRLGARSRRAAPPAGEGLRRGRMVGGAAPHGAIGAENARFVLSYLDAAGIPVDGRALGGTTGLAVRFQPHTGRVGENTVRRCAGRFRRGLVKPVKVLVVDDSALMRQLLAQILQSAPGVQVVGSAADPYAAWEKIHELEPDVLTLDVEMPRMDGLTFLRKLMTARPMPVVMVSSLTEAGCETTLKALELGAVDFVTKPKLDLTAGTLELAGELVDKVRGRPGRGCAPAAPRSPRSGRSPRSRCGRRTR
ncbi:Chemotaxis response regulator protein-glutamate methylesterase CheB [Frigoriglobus tundricola]|uniref:Probable chemoreceptor glutamine deamidase CheD n=1 Tax=Frigoriglobus tundricola TaxID=2774151 RepID=A0A6M5YXM7_9BACT|nr:CheR family methyltransferase [Frigoriglobus tundricola]QJW98244.1 Chemotaxis response regulator protein-glutamate methylesterase CheB [Frigoriglobus tundricola]